MTENRASGPRTMIWGWITVLLLTLAAGISLLAVRFDDGLSKVFVSDTEYYQNYRAYLDDFSVGEGDLLVVMQADDFADGPVFQAVRDFIFEVQFEDQIAGLISPFSFDVDPGAEVAGAFDRLWQDNPAFRRFLSEDRKVMLISLIVAPNGHDNTVPLYHQITAMTDDVLTPAGIKTVVTGNPVLRDNIVAALFDDFLLLIVIGAVLGTAVSALALRSLVLALVSALTSLNALVWMLGLFGAVGLTVNVVTVSLPVLVLVLSFASSIHLTFEARRQARALEPAPVWRAVRRIGMACVLTTITTSAAFASLMTSPSGLISNMGLAGALATIVSLVAVFAVHPLILATLARWRGFDWLFAGQRGQAATVWQFGRLQGMAARAPVAVTLGAVLMLFGASAIYLQVQPTYSLYDNVEFDGEAFQALKLVEDNLAPIGTITFPTNVDMNAPDAMADLAQAHAAIARAVDPSFRVVSLASFAEGGDGGGIGNTRSLPPVLRDRLLSKDGSRPLILVLLPNEGAAEIRGIVTAMVGRLAADNTVPPGLIQDPTGLLVASSFLSYDMLLDLNRCFLFAVIASGLVVMVWLRNPVLGLIALVPNVLPVALVGAWLSLSGRGLEFSSGIALTIAFGLAIDDTIHVLNRIRLNAADGGRGIDRELILASVRQTAPALVITSVVLSLGMLGTQFGQLASVSYFGMLSIAAFGLALIADLLVLPAILITARKVLPEKMLRIGSW